MCMRPITRMFTTRTIGIISFPFSRESENQSFKKMQALETKRCRIHDGQFVSINNHDYQKVSCYAQIRIFIFILCSICVKLDDLKPETEQSR